MPITYREADRSFDLSPILSAIPEFQRITPELVRSRTASDSLLLIAENNDRVIGFKLGYALSPETFYSWIGAVIPDYRRGGVARTLLQLQEQRIRQKGYSSIRVKSMNRFPAMLHLLISEHYHIIDLEHSTISGEGPKIVFEKPAVSRPVRSF